MKLLVESVCIWLIAALVCYQHAAAAVEEDAGNEIITVRIDPYASLRSEVDEMQTKLDNLHTQVTTQCTWPEPPAAYRQKYLVYHVSSPLGTYQLTQNEARDMCEERGAIQASYEQLVSAFNAGLERCACGWVSEGFSAYPMQWPRQGCGNQAAGVRTCSQTKADGWCFGTT